MKLKDKIKTEQKCIPSCKVSMATEIEFNFFKFIPWLNAQ